MTALRIVTRGRSFSHKSRMLVIIAIFVAIYGVIGARLFYYGTLELPIVTYAQVPPSVARPNIVDRNGQILAMDIPSVSIFAEPRRIVDVDEAVEKLTAVFPELDSEDLHRRLSSDSGFAWIKRTATVAEKERLWAQGIPAIGYRDETKRLYPNGLLAAHVLGAVNIDNVGIAGIERWIDNQGLGDLRAAGIAPSNAALSPIRLSLDIRIQHALTLELNTAMTKFQAMAAAGLVLDVTNGEILALTSLPDFDPNSPADALKPDRINRINVGTYEMGSTFKAMTTAMALDSGMFNINSVLDASQPLRFGRMSIRDYRGQNRPLNIPEAFIHSSNIAMGRMAMTIGPDRHQQFLRKLGQFDRLTTELPESARPILPARWAELTTATASFGHGIAVTPLQASMGIASLINGGSLIKPTFLKGATVDDRVIQQNVVSDETREAIRFLLRLNAEIGSAKKADVEGYYIGGKTGTSEKVVEGRYSSDRVLTAFMGVVPMTKPRYLFLTILDEPKPLPETFGFRTSGWNAVPVTGDIFRRTLSMLNVSPSFVPPDTPFPRILAQGAWGSERFAPQTEVLTSGYAN